MDGAGTRVVHYFNRNSAEFNLSLFMLKGWGEDEGNFTGTKKIKNVAKLSLCHG